MKGVNLTQAISVSELLGRIKSSLESEFHSLYIEGEVSALSRSITGHLYFNLADQSGQITCVMFKRDTLRSLSAKKLKVGDVVQVLGKIGLYTKKGQININVEQLVLKGEGDLALKFKVLKDKLMKEGLFDPSRKKTISPYPRRLVLITSPEAAALKDFINIYKRRAIWYEILIIPALVQGETAAASIMKALEKAKRVKNLDAIILTRGGGSMEDLWCFNDEDLIRMIYDMSTPVISAIGHERDFTLSDYVADLRAETPSAAAEMLTQYQTQVKDKLGAYEHRLNSGLTQLSLEVEAKEKRYDPQLWYDWLERRVEHLQAHIQNLNPMAKAQITLTTHEQEYRLDELLAKSHQMMIQNLDKANHLLDEHSQKSAYMMEQVLEKSAYQLEALWDKLDTLGPHQTLKRGFAMVESKEGKILTSADDFERLKNDRFWLHFHDNKVEVTK